MHVWKTIHSAIYLECRVPVGEMWEMELKRKGAGRSSRALGAKLMCLNFILMTSQNLWDVIKVF